MQARPRLRHVACFNQGVTTALQPWLWSDMQYPDSLEAWLARLIAVHPERIELGLERIRAVYEVLAIGRPAPIVLTVAGTNGKGSTVAFLSAMLRAAGYRVGSYTSPHLFRFNERIVVDGAAAEDEAIIAAFRRVEQARAGVELTFFEHATLAAFVLFAQARLDVAVLEVGLGGRLDAVNLVDADVAIVTTVDLDHQHLLGETREAIALEKAGVFRAGCPAVVADPDPPASLLAEIERIGAHPLRIGHEFRIDVGAVAWRWIGAGTSLRLPHPRLQAPVQHANAAAAIAALLALRERLHVPFRALRIGLAEANLRGRMEVHPGAVEMVVDVGHNPQAARVLAEWMRQHPRRTRAVFSTLADKDVVAIVQPLRELVVHWHLVSLDALTSRGRHAGELRDALTQVIDNARCTLHDDAQSALAEARAGSDAGDRILVFGSFYLVAALAPTLNPEPAPAN